MPTLFSSEAIIDSSHVQDRGRLVEMDRHELMRADDGSSPVATFDQLREIGRLFLSQKFNMVLPSSMPLPEGLLQRHEQIEAGAFWGKLALGAGAESQFPVTVEIVPTPTGRDLRLQIVPIHFGALEVAQFGLHTDTLLALAAAAAVAPQFLLALEGGIATTQCSTKKEIVTSITPDHGTPLAATFGIFQNDQSTLESAIAVTGNPLLSIKQAAHLHGQPKPGIQRIATAAAGSRIAAGVPIRTALRSELPKHALYIQTTVDGTGRQRIVSVQDSLQATGIDSAELALMAAALGFTARVVGDSGREKTIQTVLRPNTADTPLAELFRK